MKNLKFANPFYVILLIAGVMFTITACAYGVMVVIKREPAQEAAHLEHPLIAFMDEHGLTLLLVELVILGLATFAAIVTDEFWMHRAEGKRSRVQKELSSPDSAAGEHSSTSRTSPDAGKPSLVHYHDEPDP